MHVIYENGNEVVIQFSEDELETIIHYANKNVNTIPQFIRWLIEAGCKLFQLTLEMKG